jgi:hypothetical protein
MNIIDFLFISIIFLFCAYNKNDKPISIILRAGILIGLIVIYNRKYNLRENFIKCYSGHEPAKVDESYNNVNKAWCKFTGIPDSKEIVIPKKYPSTIYDVSTELDPNLNYELIDKQIRSARSFDEQPKVNHAIFSSSHFDKQDIKYEEDKPKYINLNEGVDNTNTSPQINNVHPSINKLSVLDKTIDDFSKKAKKYSIRDMKIHIFKPFMKGNNIEDSEPDIEHFTNQCINKNYSTIMKVQTSTFETDKCSIPIEEEVSDDVGHYHPKNSFTLRKNLMIRNLVKDKFNIRDQVPLVILLVNNDLIMKSYKKKHVFDEQIKPLLMNKIAVAVVNYNNDSNNTFQSQFYRINYIIQHFKKYSNEYGINKNRVGLIASGLGGVISYILNYYKTSDIRKIETLMDVKRPQLQESSRCNVLQLINPTLFVNNCEKFKFINNTEYLNDPINVYSPELKEECFSNMKELFGISEITNNYVELFKMLNLLEYFNSNRSYTPLMIECKGLLNNKTITLNELKSRNNVPVESYILYQHAMKMNVKVDALIPEFGVEFIHGDNNLKFKLDML